MREDGAESTASAIARASLDVRSASVYATLVVAVAIVPVYFLEQVPGAFFPDAATSYLLALLAALVGLDHGHAGAGGPAADAAVGRRRRVSARAVAAARLRRSRFRA